MNLRWAGWWTLTVLFATLMVAAAGYQGGSEDAWWALKGLIFGYCSACIHAAIASKDKT